MKTDRMSGFIVEDITVGPFAHGFGVTGDGRWFAFRTVGATLALEIYRAEAARSTAVPGPEDVTAVAAAGVTDIDLGDERSVVAAVRDLIAAATPVPDRASTTARGLLGRLGAVLDGR
ncbi:hypothetical protein NWFMUON74_33220 [Nocardia wallacei]|uniref:Uncharacterized protein n=2 Tax=Nocardia wallacei TaxID=480035 RepID=A0A7G1KKF5_9NOCA|nr:hypothetical protein NWFMUON74_33220 [Nocardia wallacei]